MIKQFTIGRGDECQIRIQDQSQRVSRNHATIKIYESGKMFIIDQSSNGTWVNGVKISQNVEYPIKRGDSISFAHVVELNWEQIPRTTNKSIIYVLATLLLVGLITGGYFMMYHLPDKEKQKTEQLRLVEIKRILDREKAVKDSIRRADSIRISSQVVKKVQAADQKKEKSKTVPVVQPTKNDSVKKEKKISLIQL